MSERETAMTLHEIDADSPEAQREQTILRYWRHGNLTPLGVANSLAWANRRMTNTLGEPHSVSATQ